MPRSINKKHKPGPKPESVKAEGVDWKDAMRHAMGKPKPKEGWPDQAKSAKDKDQQD